MKIALVAPLEERVPPIKYGGTELVVFNLVENLVKQGHQVTLIASGDSQTKAQLVSIYPQGLRFYPQLTDLKLRDAYKYMGVGAIISYLSQYRYDIVHNHLGWRLLGFESVISSPVITTLHGPLDVDYQKHVYRAYSRSAYVSISLNQRRPLTDLNYVANVYNGIDTAIFPVSLQAKDYFAFLGRMSPEKGPIQAIQVAKQAGVKLIMAAKVDAVDQAFFEREVKPLIDGQQIQFIGEVDHQGKVALLGSAKALIAPIQWEEPFGLYFIEAMACGTPVITMKRGAAPEIVIDNKTGFLCTDLEEAVSKVGQIDKIDRATCAAHIEAHFSVEKMTADYLAAYKRTISLASGLKP